MRIIGGHDYYDGALAFGQDTDVVFVRNKETIIGKDILEKSPLNIGQLSPLHFKSTKKGLQQKYTWRRHDDIITKDGVYYCYYVNVYVGGKYYGGIEVIRSGTAGVRTWTGYFWSLDKFKRWVQSKGYDLRDKPYWYGKDIPTWEILDTYHFNRQIPQKELDWLIENRVSVAMCVNRSHRDYPTWEIDTPCLAGVQFAKRLDPYACFQELSMWVGGVLPRNPNPMVTITDQNIKRDKAGFDEWSFKKKVR